MYFMNARFMRSTTTLLISSGPSSVLPLVRTWLPTELTRSEKLLAARAPMEPCDVVAVLRLLTLGVRVVLAVVLVGHGGKEGAVALPVSRCVHPSPADDAHVGVARHHLAKAVKDKGEKDEAILQ